MEIEGWIRIRIRRNGWVIGYLYPRDLIIRRSKGNPRISYFEDSRFTMSFGCRRFKRTDKTTFQVDVGDMI